MSLGTSAAVAPGAMGLLAARAPRRRQDDNRQSKSSASAGDGSIEIAAGEGDNPLPAEGGDELRRRSAAVTVAMVPSSTGRPAAGRLRQ
jgi:hypothetical protein